MMGEADLSTSMEASEQVSFCPREAYLVSRDYRGPRRRVELGCERGPDLGRFRKPPGCPGVGNTKARI